MKKYRVIVFDEEDLENVFEGYTSELGQAMIEVKSQGHELRYVLKSEADYLWQILNVSNKIAKDEVYFVYGSYTKAGRQIIDDITTK